MTPPVQSGRARPRPRAASSAEVGAAAARSLRDAADGRLLERREELARLEAAFADARAGRGRFVVIEGPAGIGKTALLAATRTAAAFGGMRVLRSRGTELESGFAYGVVRQLFEPALAEVPAPERAELLQDAAGRAAGLLGLQGAAAEAAETSATIDPSFAILHGLYWLCANLAAAGPLCLMVDDAHWADSCSLRFLAFLLTRLEELDVALVLATRPREAGTDAGLLATVTTDPSAETIRLPPLSGSAVGQLVEAKLAAVPDPDFVAACLRATRGLPFLLHELVEALGEAAIAPTAAGARHVERIGARTVGRSIRLRLRRLPEHAGALARALAVLEESELLPASQLAGLEKQQAEDAAELLETAGILGPGRPLSFSHPIVRAGLYAELTGAERARGHRRAARLLAEQPGAGERVARHLLASEPAADEWVVVQLLDAACAVGHRGAPETEAAILRRALAEPPPQAVRPQLLLDLGMAEASAGLAGWHEHLQEAADATPDATAAAGAAMVLGLALSRAQRTPEAVEVLDLAAASLAADHAELGLLLEAAAVFPAMNDPATAPSVALRRERLLEAATGSQAPPRELLAAAAFVSVLANDPAEVGADLALRARDGVDGSSGSEKQPWFSYSAWFSQMTFSLLWTERYTEVRALLDGSIAEARAAGDSSLLSMGLANRAWLSLRVGDLVGADGDARTALAATKLPAPPMYRVLNGALLVETLVEQGEVDAAEQALAPLASETNTGSLVAAVLHFARGRLRVAQGRVAEGLEDFLAVGAILARALVTCPAYLPWRSEAALAQLALGERERARHLAQAELELARAFGAPRAIGLAKRAAGVVAGGDRGELLLREAILDFERSDAGLERARALTDLGAMLRRRNRRTEARALLREALDAAHRSGAVPLAERAETELRATGARPRRVVLTGLESLTASERRIAELAGQGLTNREIAQTLFVTARTVEGHLTGVFRKLDLDSRSALPAALAAGAPVSA